MRTKEISPQLIQEIKLKINLIDLIGKYLPLNPNLKANCPFHSEKTPSFSIHPNKKFWHCFGCGASGDAITFIQRIEGLSFADAVTLLAQEIGISFSQSERFNRYLARKWERKKDQLNQLSLFKRYLKAAQLDRENELRNERKNLPPKTRWNSWNSKQYLQEQLIDYRFELLDQKMRKLFNEFETKESEIRNG